MPGWLRSFKRDEDGSGTIFSLFMFIVVLLMGGLALDASQVWRVHAILQATADAAAYSGAVRLSEPLDTDPAAMRMDARAAAEENARESLHFTHLASALHDESVEVGWLDADTRVFTPNALPMNAVRVRLSRREEYGTAEPTMLMHLVGLTHWNVQGEAIATVFNPPSLGCNDPLLSLKARTDIEARDVFLGICLHANAQTIYGHSIQWKNAHTDGLIDGLLAEALGLTATSATNVVSGVTGALGLGGTTSEASTVWPERNLYSTLQNAVATADTTLTAFGFDVSDLEPGKSYRILCDDLAVVRIPTGSVLEGVAIYSDCPIKFGPRVTLRSSLVISNLKSLLEEDVSLSITPDISITQGSNCLPGDGVKIYLFMNVQAAQSIPALVDSDSPLGQFIEESYEGAGGILSNVLNTAGALTADLAEAISTETSALGLADVCIGAKTMLDSDTIALR